jgi:hypothetical protein
MSKIRDIFVPELSAIEAVQRKLDEFFAEVDLKDAEFNAKVYTYRMQKVSDYFGIPEGHYTSRTNAARSLLSLRNSFKPTWIARKHINVARDLLRGYVSCIHCHQIGVSIGLLTTSPSVIGLHPSSITHRDNAPAAEAASEPFSPASALDPSNLTPSQLYDFLVDRKPPSSRPAPPLRQLDLGEVGVHASALDGRDEQIRALIAGLCTSQGLPPYTAAKIFSNDVLAVSQPGTSWQIRFC